MITPHSPAAKPIDLWLDTDPGFDDWMAWLLIESLPETFRLHGVSVVAGNAPLARVERNALKIKALHGFATPVWRGADRPLAQAQTTAQDVLGEDGMETTGARLPELAADGHAARSVLAPGHAVQALIDAVRANPGRITLLAVGPLTNVALAFALAPELPSLLAGLVIMGGSTTGGNASAAAEFNIYADPDAAARVFATGSAEAGGGPVVMFGLNVCAQVRVGADHVRRVAALPGLQAQVFSAYLDAYVDIARQRGRPSQSLYDPSPVIWLARPELFELKPARVEVELAGRFTRGMTVCDWRAKALAWANARVAVAAQGEAALAFAFAAIERRLDPHPVQKTRPGAGSA